MEAAEPFCQLWRQEIRPGRHYLTQFHKGGPKLFKGRNKAFVFRALAALVWSLAAEQSQTHQSRSSGSWGEDAEHVGEAAIVMERQGKGRHTM